MATTPQFLGPDGVLREDLTFTTTINSRFFTGTIGENTVDLQVSIRGSVFSSDPDLVVFEGTSFTIPNPSSFPEGLDLLAGLNTIELRSVDTTGSVSNTASADVTLVQEADLGVIAQAPTGICLERLDDTVEVTVEGINSPFFRGINFYASVSPGGGTNGYDPINVRLVSDSETTEEVETLATLTVDSDVLLGSDGNHAADPHFFSVLGTQQDEDENILQTDFNERLELPEDVRDLRTQFVVSRVRQVNRYSFVHDRGGTASSSPPTIPNASFTAIPREDLVYYVARAVFFDTTTGIEFESANSPEVAGTPLTITATLGSFPEVTRERILANTVRAINRPQPEVNLLPGAVIRDTVVDPFTQESQRIRFLVDFIHRAQNFQELLLIDDPALTGGSVSVAQSSYKLFLKQALQLSQDADVQEVIDQAFDKQASNFGVFRLVGVRARGEATFFVTVFPTASIPIPIGTIISGGNRQFRTTQAAEITLENIASFFTGQTGRYAVRVSIEAVDPGAGGNIGPGQISTVVTGPAGVQVTNENSTFGGKNRETNRELATRAQRRLVSVDSGTLGGYTDTASKVAGVSEISVVEAGNPLMQRDFDEASGIHRGGKVDIWVRGTRVNSITDTFAFRFEIANDVVMEPVGPLSDLRFKALDDRLSPSNPIIEMLDIPAFSLGMTNATSGSVFNLDNVVIEDFNVIVLSNAVVQPDFFLTDVIVADFRFRSSEAFVFPRQPVRRVNFLRGQVTGDVSDSAFVLERLASPLQEGRSTDAGDQIRVIDTGESGATIPSGDPIAVADETHVIIGQTTEFLNNLGINPVTVQVRSADRTILYAGPFDPSGSNDYTIIDGTETSPLGIRRTDASAIASGQELSIDYFHDENFTVGYDTNFLVQAVQEDLDAMRHITADVVAKEAVINPVRLSATVVLNRGQQPRTVNRLLRTNLENFFRGQTNGRPLRPSDVIGVMENTAGVSYVVTPITRLSLDEGSLLIREEVASGQTVDATLIEEWSTETVNVYLIRDNLDNATTNGGGPETDFRGVFEDDFTLELQTVQPDTLGGAAGRAFIIGNSGLVIPGISDDTTLDNQGFRTNAEKSAERANLTGNRILVSLLNTDSPTNHLYAVTYIVGQDEKVRFLDPGPAEALSLGNVDFTFDEERERR